MSLAPRLAAWERRPSPSAGTPDRVGIEWTWELFAAAPAGVVLTSPEGQELAANDAARRLLAARACSEEGLLAPLGREGCALGRLAAAGVPARAELRCTSANGESWIEAHVVPLPSGRLAWYLQDVSQRHAGERALAESEQRYRQLAEHLGEVFWVFDLAGSRVLYASAAYETLWGRSLGALYVRAEEWLDAVHPDDRAALLQARRSAAAGAPFEVEYRVERPDGSLRHVLDRGTALAPADGSTGRLLGIAEDVTRFREAEETLRRQARTDPLTGLGNRRHFEERLRQEAARSRRRGGQLSIAILDVDRLKRINDRHGHATGDAALLAVAGVLAERLRAADTSARIGGDELGLLLPDTTAEEARVLCEDVCRHLRGVRVGEPCETAVSVSVGIASLGPGEAERSLLARADEALAAAKRGGRRRVRLAVPQPREAAPAKPLAVVG